MDDRPDRAAQGDRVVQRSDRERGLHVGVHRVADDATRERVFDGAEIELALDGGVLGDIGEPQLVGGLGAEGAAHEIVVHRLLGPGPATSLAG